MLLVVKHFLLLLEQDDLDTLSWNSIANAFEGESCARPQRTLEVVEDSTSVAVLLSDALPNHLSD